MRTFSLVVILFAAVVVNAQGNKGVCSISSHNMSLKEGRGTGRYIIATFPLEAKDEITRKTTSKQAPFGEFHIEAEIEYDGIYSSGKQKPKYIQLTLLAMRADDPNAKTAEQTVEARIPYRKKWGTGSVSKVVVVDDIAYTFELTCNDGVSRRF